MLRRWWTTCSISTSLCASLQPGIYCVESIPTILIHYWRSQSCFYISEQEINKSQRYSLTSYSSSNGFTFTKHWNGFYSPTCSATTQVINGFRISDGRTERWRMVNRVIESAVQQLIKDNFGTTNRRLLATFDRWIPPHNQPLPTIVVTQKILTSAAKYEGFYLIRQQLDRWTMKRIPSTWTGEGFLRRWMFHFEEFKSDQYWKLHNLCFTHIEHTYVRDEYSGAKEMETNLLFYFFSTKYINLFRHLNFNSSSGGD